MALCAFCGGRTADEECGVCRAAAGTIPALLLVQPLELPAATLQLFVGAGTPAALRHHISAAARAVQGSLVVCLADPSRIPPHVPEIVDDHACWLTATRAAAETRAWYAAVSAIGAAVRTPGLLVNALAQTALQIPSAAVLEEVAVDVPAGRFTLLRIAPTHYAAWDAEAGEAPAEFVVVPAPSASPTWRAAARRAGEYLRDEMAERPVAPAPDVDDAAARAASANVAETTVRRELSPWDAAAIAQALDPADVPTLVQPIATRPLPPPVPERRFVDMQSPETVAAGADFTVTCAIRLPTGPRADLLEPVDVPFDGVTVQVGMFVDEGLEFRSSNWQPCKLYPGVDSEVCEFRLHALAPPPRAQSLVTVTVVAGTQVLGGAKARVRIGAATGPLRPVPSAPLAGPRPRADGDVLLTVVNEVVGGVRRLRFHWDDGRVRALRDLVVTVSSQHTEVLADARRTLWQLAHEQPPAPVAQMRKRLRSIGLRLWTLFLPGEIQTLLRTYRDEVKRVLLLTDDTAIPWELLYPPSDGELPDEWFLAERTPLTRWPTGTQLVSTLRTEVAHVAIPTNAPAAAASEAQIVRDIIARTGRSESITDFDRLLSDIEAGEFHILHFACHDLLEAGHLNFGGVPFGVNLLHTASLALNPLVFVNAGRSAPVTEAAFATPRHWAHAVIEKRAAAFVGTQWRASTEAAMEFARAFYDRFVDGMPLGDAAMLARNAINDRPGDPSWLAYAVYGDPIAAKV